MFHSPDAVDSRSMFKVSAHPSHAPHVPHASSRTTDRTFASRSPAPRSNGRLILGLIGPTALVALTRPGPAPAPFRAERTPAVARTSTIGAWPPVLCIRCTYVQLSLSVATDQDVICNQKGKVDVPRPKHELSAKLRRVPAPLPHGHPDAQRVGDNHR